MDHTAEPSFATALLNSRAVLRLTGRDARSWLQSLVTNDVEQLAPGEGRYAALLTPQGKIMFDFFVTPDADSLLIDCLGEHASSLSKRLMMYKLRADVAISPPSHDLMVAAAWGGNPPPVSRALVFSDPRAPAMGWRLIGEAQEFDLMGIEAGHDSAYMAHRIDCGVPEGGTDFAYNDAFPHEANMDLIHGVDFRKGCYIGQEVVSRVHHRGTARKRIVKVAFAGQAPRPGAAVMMGDVAIGETGSAVGRLGLAVLRLDRIEDAKTSGARLTAEGVEVTVLAERV